MVVQPTHRDWRVGAGHLWQSDVGEGFVRQHRADVGLAFSVLGEGVAGVIVVLVAVLHRQLFTVPAPWRRTAAVGQGYQLAAHCPHWATHMHVYGCDGGGAHDTGSPGCNFKPFCFYHD